MGTGIDHRPGRTSSTGGMTFWSQAAFCAVPVTTTTTGTVHGTTVEVVASSAPRTASVRGPEQVGFPVPGTGPSGKSLKWAGRVPTMRASTRPRQSATGHGNRVGRGVMTDRPEGGIVERRNGGGATAAGPVPPTAPAARPPRERGEPR